MTTRIETTLNAMEAWNHKDLDTYRQLYDPQAQIYGLAPVPVDPQGALGIYQIFFTGFPDIHVHIEDALEEGDQVVLRYTTHGTHKGEFQGLPATEHEIHIGGMSLLTFNQEGKVVERWSQLNQIAMMQQLGVFPSE